jgi:hypothetical protein
MSPENTSKTSTVKYHHTDEPESSFQNGLWTGSSVTGNPNLTAAEAVRQLGLKQIPDKIIPIKDNGHFRPNTPPIFKPHYHGPGGGTDFTNDKWIPPKDILPAIQINP